MSRLVIVLVACLVALSRAESPVSPAYDCANDEYTESVGDWCFQTGCGWAGPSGGCLATGVPAYMYYAFDANRNTGSAANAKKFGAVRASQAETDLVITKFLQKKVKNMTAARKAARTTHTTKAAARAGIYTGGVYTAYAESVQYPKFHFLNPYATSPYRSTLQDRWHLSEEHENTPLDLLNKKRTSSKNKRVSSNKREYYDYTLPNFKSGDQQDGRNFRNSMFGAIANKCGDGCNSRLAESFYVPKRAGTNNGLLPLPLTSIRFYGYILQDSCTSDDPIAPGVTISFNIWKGDSPNTWGSQPVYSDSALIASWDRSYFYRDSQSNPGNVQREVYQFDFNLRPNFTLTSSAIYWIDFQYETESSEKRIFTPMATVPGYVGSDARAKKRGSGEQGQQGPNGGPDAPPSPKPVYQSFNGGANWNMLETADNTNQNIVIAINPLDCMAGYTQEYFEWGHCSASAYDFGGFSYDGNIDFVLPFYNLGDESYAWIGCHNQYFHIDNEHRSCPTPADSADVTTCSTTACVPLATVA